LIEGRDRFVALQRKQRTIEGSGAKISQS